MISLQPSVLSTRSAKALNSVELNTVAAASQFIWDGLWSSEGEHAALDMCDAVLFGGKGVIDKWLFTSHDKLVRKRRARTATWDMLANELLLRKDAERADDGNRKVATVFTNGACEDVLAQQVMDLQQYSGLEFLVFSRHCSSHRMIRQTYEFRRSNHKRLYPFMQTHVVVDQSLKLGTCVTSQSETGSRVSTVPSVSNEINSEADRLTSELVAAVEQRKGVRIQRLVIVLLVGESERTSVRVQYHHATQVVYTSRRHHALQSVESVDSIEQQDTLAVSSSLRTSFNAIGRCVGDFCSFVEADELQRMQSNDNLPSSWKEDNHSHIDVQGSITTDSLWQPSSVQSTITTGLMKSRNTARATRRLAYKSIAQARLEWGLRFNPPDSRRLNDSELPVWPAPLLHWCERQLQQEGVQHGLGAKASVLGLSKGRQERLSAPDRIKPTAAALYYDDVGVCRNCYKVYTDLDKRRKAAHRPTVVQHTEQDADPWAQLEQQMQREVKAEQERALFRRLHESKRSRSVDEEGQNGRVNSRAIVRGTSKTVLPPVPWALQDHKDAAAYAAQGSSFIRNIGHKAKESVNSAKHAMDQSAGPDLSYLFEKPSQLPAKPVLVPQRQFPQAIATQPTKPTTKHKFQHERLMHPWQREFERIKKEEAAAEMGEQPQDQANKNGHQALQQQYGAHREDDDEDDDDDDEGIGWSPFLVPLDST